MVPCDCFVCLSTFLTIGPLFNCIYSVPSYGWFCASLGKQLAGIRCINHNWFSYRKKEDCKTDPVSTFTKKLKNQKSLNVNKCFLKLYKAWMMSLSLQVCLIFAFFHKRAVMVHIFVMILSWSEFWKSYHNQTQFCQSLNINYTQKDHKNVYLALGQCLCAPQRSELISGYVAYTRENFLLFFFFIHLHLSALLSQNMKKIACARVQITWTYTSRSSGCITSTAKTCPSLRAECQNILRE